MFLLIHLFFEGVLGFLTLELALYWGVLAAARWKRLPPPLSNQPLEFFPTFCLVIACRDGAACLPGLAGSLNSQDYPADRRKMFLVADCCSDNSAELARSLGFEVFERHYLPAAGKGNSLNAILAQRLQREPFDVLVVLDVDAAVKPVFLRRMAHYFRGPGPRALSCATYANNPTQSSLARVGEIIQRLLRLHQEGRRALGLDAAFYGSHGYALSRAALQRLDWHTTTGQIAEDMELRLRCSLNQIPVLYGPDLQVYNDVTSDASSAREQRRRWNATYLPLIPQYLGSLLKASLKGNGRCLEALFGLLLLPSFANLFIYLTAAAGILGGFSAFYPSLRPFAGVAALLWLGDVAYFLTAFSAMRVRFGKEELRGLAMHLAIRIAALLESVFYIRVKIWAPAPHPGHRSS